MSMRAGAATARAFARAAAVKPEDPAILTCAVSGGVVTSNPNQPIDRDELIAEILGAVTAGASVVHVHARTSNGGMSDASEDYLAIKQAIRAEVEDVVLNFSAGGALDAPLDQRGLSLQAQPDMATVVCGSTNFGPSDDVLLNPRSLIVRLTEEMARREIAPEYECFDLGMVLTAIELAQAASERRGLVHLILGTMGGAPASAATISLFAGMVPVGIPWAVTAIPRHFPLMALTLALGGHIRTGLEDVAYVAPGEYAKSNMQLVTRARLMCETIGRPVATPSQARELLGIQCAG